MRVQMLPLHQRLRLLAEELHDHPNPDAKDAAASLEALALTLAGPPTCARCGAPRVPGCPACGT